MKTLNEAMKNLSLNKKLQENKLTEESEYKYTYNVDEIRSNMLKDMVIKVIKHSDTYDGSEDEWKDDEGIVTDLDITVAGYKEEIEDALKNIKEIQSENPIEKITLFNGIEYLGFKGGNVKTILKDGRQYVSNEDELSLWSAVECTVGEITSEEVEEAKEIVEESAQVVTESLSDDGNALIAKLADKVESAFSEFKGEWEFGKPNGETRKTIDDDDEYISNITYKVTVNGLIFTFYSKMFDTFSKGLTSPKYEWKLTGQWSDSQKGGLSVENANEILRATEVAHKLGKEIVKDMEDFVKNYSEEDEEENVNEQ